MSPDFSYLYLEGGDDRDWTNKVTCDWVFSRSSTPCSTQDAAVSRPRTHTLTFPTVDETPLAHERRSSPVDDNNGDNVTSVEKCGDDKMVVTLHTRRL